MPFEEPMTGLPDDLTKKLADEVGQVLPEVYRDTLQPAARETGSVLGRAVRMALAPVRGLVWTWEHAEAWLERSVEERFERRHVPPERVKSPPPQIAAGVTRGVQAAGPEPDGTLRDMFASLLATAMQSEGAVRAHPAFAEILSQITPDEARLLRVLARRTPSPILRRVTVSWVEGMLPERAETIFETDPLPDEVGIAGNADLLESYLDNLERLGLIRLNTESFEQAHLDPEGDKDSKHEAEGKRRWRVAREYLLRYGHPEVARAVDLFESLPRPDPSERQGRFRIEMSGRRPMIYIPGVWASTFGSQLLRASTEPEEFGSLADVTLDERDEDENSSSSGT
jgi:hypothetical protein